MADKGAQTIGGTVGWLGYAYNYSRVQHWSMFGYPAASPWTGEIMVQTDASYSNESDPGCVEGPATTGIGYRQTGGCSGGPWIKTYRPQQSGSNNYINGVNSYKYTLEPNRIYSPYFDDGFKSLFDNCL
jgi:hypothetical protein